MEREGILRGGNRTEVLKGEKGRKTVRWSASKKKGAPLFWKKGKKEEVAAKTWRQKAIQGWPARGRKGRETSSVSPKPLI